jgi:hypothetical protein
MSAILLQRTSLTVRQLCTGLGLSYRCFCRWHQRRLEGRPVLLPPGPHKVGPLPLDALIEDLHQLIHGPRRTHGTGAFYQRWRAYVARHPLQAAVHAQRRQHLRARRQQLQRIRWLHPNLAWAIDATEYPKNAQGHRLFHIVVQDLATTFQFEPFLEETCSGHQAAQFLRRLFQKHGPPLLLKRDNGGPFNTPEVNDLLAEFGVIPLNSPVRYPPYNGAIEHGIGELKRELPDAGRPTDRERLCLPRWYARLLWHKHNYYPRRLLDGQSATQAYFERPRVRWTRRQRQRIFAWIGARAKRMLRAMDHPGHRDLRRAWRRAVESWLRCQGLIVVSSNQQTVTPFSHENGS